jgi:photosystem II stability/assembly factor-like uncharacterized protein
MQKFLLLFLLALSVPLTAQWTVLNPHPTTSMIHGISTPDLNRFIGVTAQGEAVISFNGGANWQVIPIGGDGIYRGVYFHNTNIGWAVGAFVERLHKTTDGGLTWTHQPNAPDTTKYGVHFANLNTGWTVGFNGFIAKTTNGGDNWFSQSNTSITDNTLYGVFSTSENNVYVAGSANTILKSTNGGTDWSLYPQVFSNSTDYRSIYFTSADTGFIAGHRSRIAKTTNGGISWSPVYDPGGTIQLWSITFNSSKQIGLACGASSQLLRTSDGGNTWTPITGFITASTTFYSVSFASDNVAFLAGNSGYIFKSTDAGLTWQNAGYRFTTTSLNDVAFADNSTGYVVGTNFLAKSTDGGKTFQTQVSPFSGDINEISTPVPDTAIAAADAGNIIRTTNGGANWSLIPTGITGTNSDILAIDFITKDTGWVAAYNGTVAKTTDAGLTWSIISTIVGSNPWDMDFVNSKFGWVVGTGERIFGTSDGGVTWNQQHAGGGLGTYGVSFVDDKTGVAGGTGGNTYYTSDGGTTWNSAVTPPDNTVWGIHIASSPVYGTVALTACASGYVFKSIDGGRNWVEEPRQTINTFDDVWMTDAAHAWFAGSSGVIVGYFEPANIPVELASFSANVNNNEVLLTWVTASENNNAGYEVERKFSHETDWIIIGFVKGSGTSVNISEYTFSDESLEPGKYNYRIKQLDLNGSFKYYYLSELVEIGLPEKFELLQNYPNPFNPSTIIKFSIPVQTFVTLKVFDMLGKEVVTLVENEKPAGNYSVNFSAGNLSSGIYLYTLQAGSSSLTKKLMLIK